MEEIDTVCCNKAYPGNWAIGIEGKDKGFYNRMTGKIELFEEDGTHGSQQLKSTTGDLNDPKILELLGEELYEHLCNDIELLDLSLEEFYLEKVNNGT